MAYLNTLSLEYPRHIGDLYLIGYRDGEDIPEGWVEVVNTEMPNCESDEKTIEIIPKEINGTFYQQWQIVKLTEEEIIEKNKEITSPRVPERFL
jgi:hypothetical protein